MKLTQVSSRHYYLVLRYLYRQIDRHSPRIDARRFCFLTKLATSLTRRNFHVETISHRFLTGKYRHRRREKEKDRTGTYLARKSTEIREGRAALFVRDIVALLITGEEETVCVCVCGNVERQASVTDRKRHGHTSVEHTDAGGCMIFGGD